MVAILGGLAAIGIGGFLLIQLLSSVSVVASWISVLAAIGIGLALTYQLYMENFLQDFFDTEEVEILSSVLIGVVAGFIGYRLVEALLASFGLLTALVVGSIAVLSVVFSPAYVAGGIATIIGFVVDIIDLVGGEN